MKNLSKFHGKNVLRAIAQVLLIANESIAHTCSEPERWHEKSIYFNFIRDAGRCMFFFVVRLRYFYLSFHFDVLVRKYK